MLSLALPGTFETLRENRKNSSRRPDLGYVIARVNSPASSKKTGKRIQRISRSPLNEKVRTSVNASSTSFLRDFNASRIGVQTLIEHVNFKTPGSPSLRQANRIYAKGRPQRARNGRGRFSSEIYRHARCRDPPGLDHDASRAL